LIYTPIQKIALVARRDPCARFKNAPSQSFSIISQEISWERANWINFLEYLVLAEATIGLKCLSLRFSWMRRKGLSATQSLANADQKHMHFEI
jgi:hypothetical protein